MKIERNQIVAEALALLKEQGLDALSTHQLARRLGVKQPALYWHFKDKRSLLDAMNAALLQQGHAYRTPRAGDGWRTFLQEHARGFRRALLAYPDGARVHAGARAEPLDRDVAEAQLACLVTAGFTLPESLQALVAVSRYVVGCVLEEQAEATYPPRAPDPSDPPLLAEAVATYGRLSPEAFFEAGLAALLTGLEPLRDKDSTFTVSP